MFELAVRHFSKLDLLGAFYADNVNDGMYGDVRSHLPPSLTELVQAALSPGERRPLNPGGSGRVAPLLVRLDRASAASKNYLI